jgi:signal transduction histidine kinase
MIFTNENIEAKYLIIDSNEEERNFLRETLNLSIDSSQSIYEANSEIEALKMVAQNKIDTILISCNIAIENPAFLKKLSSHVEKDTIILLLVQPANENFANSSLENGPHDYLVKSSSLTSATLARAVVRTRHILNSKKELLDLTDAISSRDEFLSVAAHEFKTPLTVMKLKFQVSSKFLKNFIAQKEQTNDTEKLFKLFKDGEHQINKLTILVDNLLDVSRLESNDLHLHLSAVNLVELIHEVYEHFSDQLKYSKCEATFELPVELWGNWDRERLEQVFSNLLTNIIRYAPNKPFSIKASKIGDKIQLIVEDQGPGIPLSSQEKIFQRYERIEGQNTNGLGLGLYITREILEAHNGSITVENAEKGGARFVIHLPLNTI